MTRAQMRHARPPRRRASPRVVLVTLAALATLHAGAFGCLRVEDGIVVELALSALPSGGAERVWLGDGTELVLQEGSIVITEATLLRCRAIAPSLEEAARMLLGPTQAVAQHDHDVSPFTIDGPLSASLVDESTILGSFTPPPGRYCGVHLRVGPGEAEGSAHAPAPTLSVRAHGPAGEPVAASSSASEALHLELGEPIELDRRGTTVLYVSLFEDRPFATLSNAAELAVGEAELGAALLRGAARQSAIWAEGL